MRKYSDPIVVIHGYEIHENGCLGSLSRLACERVLSVLIKSPMDKVVLLGGWDLQEVGATPTIADAMKTFLLQKGLKTEQIITKRDFPSLDEYMPPRDPWEELTLLEMMIPYINPKFDKKEDWIFFVAWDFNIPRFKKMYSKYGFKAGGIPIISEPHEGLRRMKWIERAARIMRFIDPQGGGVICHEARIKRTLRNDLKPIIP